MKRVGAAWTANWLVSASYPGLIISQKHSVKIKKALRCPEILTEHILCTRQFPRSGTRDVNKSPWFQ